MNHRFPSHSGSAPFSCRQKWLLLAAVALLIMLRIPRAWEHGRFVDEEATVFLAYAWHRPWLDALFRAFGGYWNLAANATTLLVAHLVKGGIVPLERAPYLTMIMALAAQLLPAVLLLTGSATWLRRRGAVIAMLLALAVAPGTEEVFFNVLHIQFHLALCVGLILALDCPGSPRARVAYAAILFVAPLCGPIALVFLPLFGLRWLIDRDARRLEQVIALAIGGAVQMLLFYGANPMRGHLLNPDTIAAAMFLRLIAMPVLGFGKTDEMGQAIFDSKVAGGIGWWWSAAIALLFFGALLVMAIRRRDGVLWLLLASLLMAAVSFGYGMIMVERYAPFDLNSERYTFVPLMLLLFALAAMAAQAGSRFRWLCIAFLLLTLITGISRYTRPVRRLRSGPNWTEEVAKWRLDHHYRLSVWPRRWKADLSDEPHSCSPIGPNPARTKDPRYCESGWAAPFYQRRHAIAHPMTDDWR